MYIKKMLIKSFGKYQDKEINLVDGINLIYGANEAGKSTIHKFIEGMFYGFYKPYIKNKKFTLDYDRFLPWNNSNQYQGILIYNHEGKEYRIERDFMKRNDKVEIFDNSTGQNITEEFDYDTAIKLYQPASKHIGINKSTFTNTISIEQLSSKTSDDLVKEVKDSLINLGESKDEEISVRNVIDKLNKKLDDIGTATRKKTTPYGILVEEIKGLKKEKEEADKIWDNIKDNQGELNSIRLKLDDLESCRTKNEELLDYLNKEEIKKKYNDASQIKGYIHSKKQELEAIECYKDVDIKEIDVTIKKLNTNQLNNEQKKELKMELLHLDNYLHEQMSKYEQVSSLEGQDTSSLDGIIGDYSIYNDLTNRYMSNQDEINELKSKLDHHSMKNNIEKDVYTYNVLEDERKEIKFSRSSDIEIKRQMHQTLLGKCKQSKLILMISLVLFSCLLVAGIGFNNIVMSLVSIVFVISSVLAGMSIKNNNIKINHIEKDINQKVEIEKETNNRIGDIARRQKEILRKYNCESIVELWELKDRHLHINALYEETKKRYEKLIKENNSLEEEIETTEEKLLYYTKLILSTEELNIKNINLVKERYEIFKDTKRNIIGKKKEREEKVTKINTLEGSITKLEKEIEKVCKTYNADTEQDLIKVKGNKYNYHTILQDIDNKKQMLNRVLENTSLEELKDKLTKYNDENMDMNKSKEELLAEQDNLLEEILHTNKEISAYETKLINLQNSTRKLVDIEEDIAINNQKKLDYDNKIKAITIAKDSIEKISKDIQNNFAPKLNDKVSSTISKITNNKYKDIKINPNMEILTYEPDNNNLISIDKLSKGTIDQMYFGLRLGIIDVIKEDITLPLILDDCFVQYDINRLGKVIETLTKLNRQIIILSCHKRESDILTSMEMDYNSINL